MSGILGIVAISFSGLSFVFAIYIAWKQFEVSQRQFEMSSRVALFESYDKIYEHCAVLSNIAGNEPLYRQVIALSALMSALHINSEVKATVLKLIKRQYDTWKRSGTESANILCAKIDTGLKNDIDWKALNSCV